MSYISSLYHSNLENYYKKNILKRSKYAIVNKNIPKGKYDHIFLENTLAYVDDIQNFVKNIQKNCKDETRILVIYFNFMWKPVLNIANNLGLRKRDIKEPNWLTPEDTENIFKLEDFEKVKFTRRFFSLTTCQIFRPKRKKGNYSVSLIIPARNEEGNIKGIIQKIPKLGKHTEIIFVEGNSKDNTYLAIKDEISKYKGKFRCKLLKQKGKGKKDAVMLGFKHAKNDILMILDADLTVPPKDLPKFYNALSQDHGEFINGSRLIYPMENQAMRTLNYLGNHFFSLVFTYLLEQHVKDTLCGTKAFFRKDYLKIISNMKNFIELDPFGDFFLLFGATKLNLKIIEVPVRYRERTYGKTNINRFKNGFQLLRMTLEAARRIKFI